MALPLIDSDHILIEPPSAESTTRRRYRPSVTTGVARGIRAAPSGPSQGHILDLPMPRNEVVTSGARYFAPYSPDLFREEFAALDSFAAYPPDWDGNGAKAPSAGAIEQTRDLLSMAAYSVGLLKNVRVKPWSVGPIPNGNILVEWRRANGDTLDIEARGDGTCGYLLGVTRDGKRAFTEGEHASHIEALGLLLLLFRA